MRRLILLFFFIITVAGCSAAKKQIRHRVANDLQEENQHLARDLEQVRAELSVEKNLRRMEDETHTAVIEALSHTIDEMQPGEIPDTTVQRLPSPLGPVAPFASRPVPRPRRAHFPRKAAGAHPAPHVFIASAVFNDPEWNAPLPTTKARPVLVPEILWFFFLIVVLIGMIEIWRRSRRKD